MESAGWGFFCPGPDIMLSHLQKICADSDLVFDAESDLAVRTNVHELQRLVKAGLRASPQSINEGERCGHGADSVFVLTCPPLQRELSLP